MATMAMFPLGGVLLPGMLLPLRVFEPRYRALVDTVVHHQATPVFGVVMIERGSEVGGGDMRSMAGTAADIMEAYEMPNGHLRVHSLGMYRIRVNEWLPDDPYPHAVVERWDDPAPLGTLADLHTAALVKLRRALAMASELGLMTAPLELELSDDPVLAGYQAAALAPLGPIDKFSLLCAETPEQRAELLGELLEGACDTFAFQLGGQ